MSLVIAALLLAVGLVLKYLAFGRAISMIQASSTQGFSAHGLLAESPLKLTMASEIFIAGGLLLGGLSLLARGISSECEPVERVAYIIGGVALIVTVVLLDASPRFSMS